MVKNKIKAIGLFSGGLDSILAAKLMRMQGVETYLLRNTSIFHSNPFGVDIGAKKARKKAKELGFQIFETDVTDDFLEIVKNPRYGRGKNLNPCIDCRLMNLKVAVKLKDELGADFIFTGEVLGQRPMTQHRETLNKIARLAGLNGFLVRPLSAKLLEPTVPEINGILDREKLEDIHGRGRSRQIELAKNFGINDYPQPAGGCVLTDVSFCRRLSDLIEHNSYNQRDICLIKLGRHFRLSPNTKAIIGRNDMENVRLDELIAPHSVNVGAVMRACPDNNDGYGECIGSPLQHPASESYPKDISRLYMRDMIGPLGILVGIPDDFSLEIASGLVKWYGKGRELDNAVVAVELPDGGKKEIISTIKSDEQFDIYAHLRL